MTGENGSLARARKALVIAMMDGTDDAGATRTVTPGRWNGSGSPGWR